MPRNIHPGRTERRSGGGAQVRNLCGCIKIAIDFVAPESVGQCLRLTEERRLLNMEDCANNPGEEAASATHADKLQGELMVGRSAAAAVACLKAHTASV